MELALRVHTTVDLGGGTIQLNYTNASYGEGFQGEGFATKDAFIHLYYNKTYNHVIFICSNNHCPPGDYDIAKITVRAGNSGTAKVDFEPKETADNQLGALTASGASTTYQITQSAPASPSKPARNTFIFPKNSATPGDSVAEPESISEEQYQQFQQQFQNRTPIVPTEVEEDNTKSNSFWSPLRLAIGGISLMIVIIGVVLVVRKFFGGPKGPYGTSGEGTIITSDHIYTR